ncbi:MAG: hypothetical protein JXM70_08125 [Pirellulales bacterium]|nr:hypothetical protein [Pirellulales bacterium]
MTFISRVILILVAVQQFSSISIAATESLEANLLAALDSPIIIQGDDKVAYRDPAVLCVDGKFHVFSTLVRTENDKGIYSYVVQTISNDLKSRTEPQIITLGQKHWPWAEFRLTAGVVLDLRKDPRIGKYVMFFHGSGPGKEGNQDNCDANASIGIAWSDDLLNWDWPKKGKK